MQNGPKTAILMQVDYHQQKWILKKKDRFYVKFLTSMKNSIQIYKYYKCHSHYLGQDTFKTFKTWQPIVLSNKKKGK